jgi:hypothetical protein
MRYRLVKWKNLKPGKNIFIGKHAYEVKSVFENQIGIQKASINPGDEGAGCTILYKQFFNMLPWEEIVK